MQRTALLALALAAPVVFADDAPSFDPRLSVSTLVREDIFAGYLANDMDRFAAGEKRLDVLLRERPQAKAGIVAWQGNVSLFKAVRAHEQNQPDEAERYYKRAAELFNEAAAANPSSVAVAAVTGGSYALFLDRLPERYRSDMAEKGYAAYKVLLQTQEKQLEKMPLHIKGELLAGLAQMAQRSGRVEEASQYVDRILTLLPNTPYEARARKWKENPGLASRTSLVCMTCHDAGKLEAQRAALSK
jgi:tetratricopeptide (TPR) repeat protein